MFRGFSSEDYQVRHFQPSHRKFGFKIGRGPIENPTKQTFLKLSAKLRQQDLPGIHFAEKYLFHQCRRNRRPSTLELNYTSISFFLKFLKLEGLAHLEAVSRKHLEAFIEHEQDRGLKPVSVRGRLASIKAFLRYLIEDDVVRHEVLSRCISVKVPDGLPRAMAPGDVKQLLSVIDNTRNRALVLMLLRTGMRIGELLALRVQDIDLKEQKVFIYEARKTGMGRVVYFSSDAKEALVAWLEQKDPREDVLACGRKYEIITYAAARVMFVKYLKKAGLLHKGYSLHCLRHTRLASRSWSTGFFKCDVVNLGTRFRNGQAVLSQPREMHFQRLCKLLSGDFRSAPRIDTSRYIRKICREVFSPFSMTTEYRIFLSLQSCLFENALQGLQIDNLAPRFRFHDFRACFGNALKGIGHQAGVAFGGRGVFVGHKTLYYCEVYSARNHSRSPRMPQTMKAKIGRQLGLCLYALPGVPNALSRRVVHVREDIPGLSLLGFRVRGLILTCIVHLLQERNGFATYGYCQGFPALWCAQGDKPVLEVNILSFQTEQLATS